MERSVIYGCFIVVLTFSSLPLFIEYIKVQKNYEVVKRPHHRLEFPILSINSLVFSTKINGSTIRQTKVEFTLQADLLIDGKSTTCIERVYMVQYHTISHLDYMVQRIRQWTCNSQVVSSIPSGDIFFFYLLRILSGLF